MITDGLPDLLTRTSEIARAFLVSLDERPVARPLDPATLRDALGGPLADEGTDPLAVVESLARIVDPGLVASAGPRYFGFVVGGTHPAGLAADWLTSAWDQNACLFVMSPAAAVAEEVAAAWLLDLLGLPPDASVGFTTGATMANFTALAAARHAVLERAGWDVEAQGLTGAPPIALVAGDESHATIFAALQMLGLGRDRVRRIAVDEQGRMRPDALAAVLAAVDGPPIVCAQSGNVNTGAFDPLAEIADLVHARDGWLHVDGAFGLWAATVPRLRGHLAGVERADSWTTDAHKWLNVPYDSGLVFVRRRDAHRRAMTLGAPYYVEAVGGEREPSNWVAELSRRARGFAVYATLRSLGRRGVTELVDRCCRLARRMADRLAEDEGVQILNDVPSNQILARFLPAGGGDADAHTRRVIRRVQEDGTCWLGGTTWRGIAAARVSVSNWTTTDADVDRAAAAILCCTRG